MAKNPPIKGLQREQIIKKRHRLNYVSGGMYILLGLALMGQELRWFEGLSVPNVVIAAGALVVFGIMFFYMQQIARYNLGKPDEYEQQAGFKAKAHGYDVLSLLLTLVIVITILQEAFTNIPVSVVLILLGVGQLVVARGYGK